MLGAIIGDIIGSRFELDNYRKKDFELFTEECDFTDDSVMTIAIADSILHMKDDYSDLSQLTILNMQKYGRKYPNRGYGDYFYKWLKTNNPLPYNSFGNGSAMRVSECGFYGKSPDEVKTLSKLVTEVTHNHLQGIKGAEAISIAIYLAKTRKSIGEIKQYIINNYYLINFTIDEIRASYKFNETCQNTVPQALEAFFESNSFEDCIRLAISLGGDSDTIGAIAGAVAEAYYGIPEKIKKKALTYLDDDLKNVIEEFENKYE